MTVDRIVNVVAKRASLALAMVNATVVIIKNVTVDRIVNVAAKRASLALAMVNATVVVNKTYGAGYAASIS